MKTILNFIILALTSMALSSCLESDLEELDTYTGKDITGVAGVYHRYYGTDKIPGSGEVQVLQVALNYGNFEANSETGTCKFTCQIPSNFPEPQLSHFSLSNVVVVLNISTAAVIKPIEDAPKLGVPGDWSKPNKYEVTAADGSKKIWTCTLVQVQ